jgi:cytochrome c5
MRHHVKTLITAAALILIATPVLSAESSQPAAKHPPLAAGKKIYGNKCGTCHALERSLTVKSDRAVWESTIKRMIEKGAKLKKDEVAKILGYLSARSAFETKCNACHDLQRPLTAIKDPEQWQASVKRMAAMKPAQIADADAVAIAQYLSLVTRVKPAAPATPVKPAAK